MSKHFHGRVTILLTMACHAERAAAVVVLTGHPLQRYDFIDYDKLL